MSFWGIGVLLIIKTNKKMHLRDAFFLLVINNIYVNYSLTTIWTDFLLRSSFASKASKRSENSCSDFN